MSVLISIILSLYDCHRLFTMSAYPCKVVGIGPSSVENLKQFQPDTCRVGAVFKRKLQHATTPGRQAIQPIRTHPEPPQRSIFYWTEWEAFANFQHLSRSLHSIPSAAIKQQKHNAFQLISGNLRHSVRLWPTTRKSETHQPSCGVVWQTCAQHIAQPIPPI